jgi:hypothetical protein
VVAQKAFHKGRDCGRREVFEARLCGIFAVADTRK